MKNRTLLSTDCHRAAARNFGRAANARRLALQFPHMAERELESCRFWAESGHHHRRMAALVAERG